jgi:hypothetical protein
MEVVADQEWKEVADRDPKEVAAAGMAEEADNNT